MIDDAILRERLQRKLSPLATKLQVHSPAAAPPYALAQTVRKRGISGPVAQPAMYLCRSNGVLYWDVKATSIPPGLRRGQRRGIIPANFIDKIMAMPLEANMVASFLRDLDGIWNKAPGLKRWDGAELKPIDPKDVAKTGSILLIVHGTFSHADAITKPLNKAGVLAAAQGKYKQVLAFDHPSISVSPVMNAVDLARSLAGSRADIDVITHSRGGLVTRWWLETLDRGPGKRRAVFVGSPLDGTSLATPKSIRNLMSWFSNLSATIGELSDAGSSVFPFMAVVAGLARLSSTVSDIGSKLPIADAAMSMVPGLSAMSKGSFELERSKVKPAKALDYYAITSNYEPSAVGWEFWKAFQGDPKLRVANAFVDPLFDGPNDLVVDTASMNVLTASLKIPAANIHSFGRNDKVYHTNYFEQDTTIAWIKAALQIP